MSLESDSVSDSTDDSFAPAATPLIPTHRPSFIQEHVSKHTSIKNLFQTRRGTTQTMTMHFHTRRVATSARRRLLFTALLPAALLLLSALLANTRRARTPLPALAVFPTGL
jgi:hypothetical protein